MKDEGNGGTRADRPRGAVRCRGGRFATPIADLGLRRGGVRRDADVLLFAIRIYVLFTNPDSFIYRSYLLDASFNYLGRLP